MRAEARIVAEADGRGGTRLAVLRGESPLRPFRTGPPAADRAGRPCRGVTVHLVGGAAGPLPGDNLRLDVEVRPGARLEIRSVAATLALPGPPGRPASRLEIRAVVEAGATLRWQPEPLIAAAGCRHEAVVEVAVAAGATLVWRDDLVCGRSGEAPGDVRTDLAVRYAGATLYRHGLAVGPGAPGWSGAAVLGGDRPSGTAPDGGAARAGGAGRGRATGSAVLVGPHLPAPAVLGGEAALMPLAGPGMVATAVGADIRSVRAALDPICARAAAGSPGDPPARGGEGAPGRAPAEPG